MFGAKIVGIGRALPGDPGVPGRTVTNDELANELRRRRDRLPSLLSPEQLAAQDQLPREVVEYHRRRWEQFETSDEWIQQRTGIQERRIADSSIATSDLGTIAAREAMAMAGWEPQDVDAVIVATATPDYKSPSTAAIIQHKLGIPPHDQDGLRWCNTFDVNSACCSFGKALGEAYFGIAVGRYRTVLVIGAETLSRFVNIYNRDLLAILADAGFAMALEATDKGDDCFYGPRGFTSWSDGSLADLIIAPKGGSHEAIAVDDVLDPFKQGHMLTMQGTRVKKCVERLLFPVKGTGMIERALERAGLALGDISLFAMHQANLRINAHVEEMLRAKGYTGIVYHDIDRYGNTSSASTGLVLYDAYQEGLLDRAIVDGGRLRKIVCLVFFGGGLTAEILFLRWSLRRP